MDQEERQHRIRQRALKEISNFVLLSNLSSQCEDDSGRYLQAAKNCLRVVEALCLAEDWDFRDYVATALRVEGNGAQQTLEVIRILQKQFEVKP